MNARAKQLADLVSTNELVDLLKAVDRQLEPKAAAAYLRVSVRCLEEWRRRGVGPKYRKVGRRVLYSINDLEAYLAGSGGG